jgi:hypothetical protein
MKKLVTTCALMLTLVSITLSQAPATFRHPGIFNSQTDLDFIKSTVAANNGSPIVAGYQTLSGDTKGSLSYNAEPYAVVDVVASGSSPAETAFRRDAHAAYIHAMKWVVTGNSAHRDKAVQILNAWSYKFQSLSTAADKPNQPTLEASWALPIWLAGAEIIKTYNNGAANWPSADKTKFEAFVRKILTYVNGPIASAPNWYISKGLSLLAAGVYLNEAATFNSGYNIIVPQLDAITTAGEIPELTRDFVHSQYVLIGLAQSAEVAYQQGNNGLFTRTNGAAQPRLLLGTEHYSRCVMGTNTPNYQTDSQWARKSAPYEILLLRYTQFGMNVPNTRTYVLNQNRVENGAEDHFLGWLTATHSQAPTIAQSPFTGNPAPIPGKIEAENYDNGGQDLAYNDITAGNTGNVYRTDNVDIQPTTDTGGGYALGWIAQGEWTEYTVNVNTAGAYTLTARVSATTTGKTFHVELNGQNISGTLTVPNTGSYQTYATVTVTTPALTTGEKTLRIVMDAASFNINYLNFASIAVAQSPFTGSAAPIPGRIEAENYDNGGQGTAYNDLTTGNSGTAFRSEDVDIEATSDAGGGYNVGWIDAGEWLEYTVDVNTSGTYTLTTRVATTTDGNTFHIELDGQNISGTIAVPNTAAYQTFTNVSVTTPALSTGQKVLRVVMDAGGFNLNYIDFALNALGNLALNKTAVASTTEAAGFEPAKAVDGSGTTRWSSLFSDPQWIYVDLGATYNINRVKITWEAAYASAYQIQVSSNASTWTTIRTVTGNTTLINDQTGLTGSGRYVRINGTARATAYGYSIFELEVYGSAAGGRSATYKTETFQDDLLESEVSTFPNPVTDRVTVNTGMFYKNGSISLHNNNGEVLVSEKIVDRVHTFNLEGLPVGLYFIHLSSYENRRTLKVIKK